MKNVAYSIVPSEKHLLAGHPEGPHRFSAIDPSKSSWSGPEYIQLQPKPPDLELLQLVHDPSYLAILENLVSDRMIVLDAGDTYANRRSYEAAQQAAGAAIAALDAVLNHEASSGFSLARPPGHHATSRQALGFCLLNNVAILTRYAQRQGRKKILIVDFDVHHGNGTQDIFEDDPSVFYISSHQRGIFPGTGFIEQMGTGDGIGTVVNVPLPGGATDRSLELLTEQIIVPSVAKFKPDLLLVSAGFDGHWRDPLAQLNLTLRGYAQLIQRLQSLADQFCGGACVFVLEGGYDPVVLSAGVDLVFAILARKAAPVDIFENPQFSEPQIDSLLAQVRSQHGLE